ncbi:hypothetical protein D9M68_949650 [compost metagenome]
MANEEGVDHPGRVAEKHRQLGEKVAAEQMARPLVQGLLEGLAVKPRVQRQRLQPQRVHAVEHGARGHHQLQQGRVGRDALPDEAQMPADVFQTELKVALQRRKPSQFIDRIGEPVIV